MTTTAQRRRNDAHGEPFSIASAHHEFSPDNEAARAEMLSWGRPLKERLKAGEAVLEQARLVYTAATRTCNRLTRLEASVLHTKALLQYQELLVEQEKALLAKAGGAK